jgi:hypothetical protein
MGIFRQLAFKIVPVLTDWHLHYFGWVIGDGEPDRDVGDVFEWFALAFWGSASMTRHDERTQSAILVADYRYRVIAQVAFISEKACVLDFGLRAASVRDLLPDDCHEGDYVTGVIGLELPLCLPAVVPESVAATLKRKWQVKHIIADVTPKIAGPGRRTLIRDDSRVEYRDVKSTRSLRQRTMC